jgi:hypothetical protein
MSTETVGAGLAGIVAFHCRRTHERVLALVADLSDEQVAWRPPAHPHSIAFNLWHLARWTDHLQAIIPAMTPELARRLGPGRELWQAEGLAAAWGFTAADLGHDETGILMDDSAAAALPLPAKAILVEYARRAFAAAGEAVAAIDDEQFARLQAINPTSTVGSAVLAYLTPDNRHLGEIEFLRGLQGLAGTATR